MNIRTIGKVLAVTAAASAFSLTPAIIATAEAAPVVTLKAKAVPIPGYPHTGNILGAGADVEAEYTISGTEYGGYPPPLSGVTFYLPKGVKIHSQGFKTCQLTTLQAQGPRFCPKGSSAGPRGNANGVVSFGQERVHEEVSIEPFFSTSGLLFAVSGYSPVSLEFISKATLTNSTTPKLTTAVPLIETVPGAAAASTETIKVKVGGAYKSHGKPVYYGTMPKTCPKGGFPVKSILTFYGGASATASYTAPCPKK